MNRYLALGLIGLASGIAPAFAGIGTPLSPAQNAVTAVQPAAPGGIHVKIAADRTAPYVLGDKVVFRVVADKDAWFSVIDIGPSGSAALLYPNAFEQPVKVKAGQVIEIPGPGAGAAIVATAPAGTELIRVVASPTPLNAIALSHLSGHGPFRAIDGGADTVVKDLTVVSTAPVNFADLTIQTIAAPAPQLAPAALTIVTDKPSYKLGERLQLAVTSVSACYLWVIDVSADGQQHLLFPNQKVRDNHIAAGQPVIVSGGKSPISVLAVAPAGRETVVGVCSRDATPTAFRSLDFTQTFPPIDPGSPLARDLAVVAAPTPQPAAPHPTLDGYTWAAIKLTTTP